MLEVKLIAHTPDIDIVGGLATRSCWSEKGASELLEGDRGKPLQAMRRALGHGHTSVLEHNRLVWLAKARDGEVLGLCAGRKYLEASKLRAGHWLLSANLRTVLELKEEKGELARSLVKSAANVSEVLR